MLGKQHRFYNFLNKKKEKDKWAVLVNEFSEIGIDGSLIKGNISDKQDVLVKKFPVVVCVVAQDCLCRLL